MQAIFILALALWCLINLAPSHFSEPRITMPLDIKFIGAASLATVT